MKPPSKLIKKLYKDFCKEHEKIMIDLLSQAYKEGYNACVAFVNEERAMDMKFTK